MPRRPLALLVVLVVTPACGGRADGRPPAHEAGADGDVPAPPLGGRDASIDAPSPSREAGPGGAPPWDGGSPPEGAPEGADADPRDAVSTDTGAGDAASDASTDTGAPLLPEPDAPCPCGGEGFAVELVLGATPARLEQPYRLRIYCEETAPLAARDPVTGVVRVSACAGPDSAPPCLYAAFSGERALLGMLVTAEGERLDVVSGNLLEAEPTPGGLRGALSLEVAGADAARFPVGATFRACDPFRPPPPASGG